MTSPEFKVHLYQTTTWSQRRSNPLAERTLHVSAVVTPHIFRFLRNKDSPPVSSIGPAPASTLFAGLLDTRPRRKTCGRQQTKKIAGYRQGNSPVCWRGIAARQQGWCLLAVHASMSGRVIVIVVVSGTCCTLPRNALSSMEVLIASHRNQLHFFCACDGFSLTNHSMFKARLETFLVFVAMGCSPQNCVSWPPQSLIFHCQRQGPRNCHRWISCVRGFASASPSPGEQRHPISKVACKASSCLPSFLLTQAGHASVGFVESLPAWSSL